MELPLDLPKDFLRVHYYGGFPSLAFISLFFLATSSEDFRRRLEAELFF